MGVHDATVLNRQTGSNMSMHEWVLTIVIVVVLIVYLKLTINLNDCY